MPAAPLSNVERQRRHQAGVKTMLEDIQATLDGTQAESTPEEREHASLFAKWMREPNDHALKGALTSVEEDLAGRALVKAEGHFEIAKRRLSDARKAADEDYSTKNRRSLREAELDVLRSRLAVEDAEKKHAVKDVTIGDGPAGGFAVPAVIAREIDRKAVLFNPFRRLVRVERAGSSDFAFQVEIPGTTSGWVGESDTRNATNTPELRERKPTFGEVYAYPQASAWSLDDIFFDVENRLARSAAVEFARQEAVVIVTGNGSSKPTGFLNTAPATTGDDASPARDVASLQYFAPQASPAELSADDLIDLSTSIADEYLDEEDGVGWVLRRATLSQVRKLKSTSGAPLLLEGAGRRPQLLGWPVHTTGAMPSAEASPLDFPIAFGNWRRGYGLADRGSIRITADTLGAPGFVRFYVRRRVGGAVIDNRAVKLLQF